VTVDGKEELPVEERAERLYGSVQPSVHYPGRWSYQVRHGSGGDYSHTDTEAEAWAAIRRALDSHGPPPYVPTFEGGGCGYAVDSAMRDSGHWAHDAYRES
jgi:hypothetical protein